MVCIDARLRGHPPQSEPSTARIDRLIPRPGLFSRALLFAAFYPEIVALAELSSSTIWRPRAEQALTCPDDHAVIAAQISHALGGEPIPLPYDGGYMITTWLQQMAHAPLLEPYLTFPDTRRSTIDGTPKTPDLAEGKLLSKARREFRKHRHAPAWSLPRNVRSHEHPDPPPRHRPTFPAVEPDTCPFRGPQNIRITLATFSQSGSPRRFCYATM